MMERREDHGHSGPACPAATRLRLWLNEKDELSSHEFEHIANCNRCQEVLSTLTDDPGLRKLETVARSGGSLKYQKEPELRLVQQKLLAPSSSHSQYVRPASTTDPVSQSNLETIDDSSVVINPKDVADGLAPGRFIVEQVVASGGSGTVYRAYDQKLSRQVAIKVLSRKSMRDRQRFQREAKILAELEHPNIVRVFDAGDLQIESRTDTTAPMYLVLEYMIGGSARSLCDVATDIDVNPKPDDTPIVDFVQLAQLIAQAADGLSCAHERGMIHRDIKPGNLLLNEDRTLMKVADFGLARVHSAEVSLATRSGDLMGTPAYMSPEQIQNPDLVTHQSDIYSLGASLYQLLTGQLPFQGNTASVLRQIVDSRPIAPRLISPSIPHDLETICLHAMEREPSDRYRNMREFADDLRRFCIGQPINARPATTFNHIVRYMRQNKGITSLIALCASLLMTLTVGSVVATVVLSTQRSKLITSEASERGAKEAAVKALQSSISAADDLLLAVTTETEYLPQTTGSQQVIRKLLEKARDYYKGFLTSNSDNHALKLQLAKAHAGLAEVAARVGDREELERETQSALDLLLDIPDSEISPVQRAILASDARIVLANFLLESGDAKGAFSIFDKAKWDLIQYTGIADTEPEKSEWQSTYATSVLGLANTYTKLGQRDKAFSLLEEAKETYTSLLSSRGDLPSLLRNAAACYITLATTSLDLQRSEEGKMHLLDATKLLDRIPEGDAISLRVRELRVRLLTNLALAERRLGNNQEAKSHYQSAIDQTKRLMELEPSVASHQWNLVVASLNSGGPDMELGLNEELVTRWKETVPILDNLIKAEPDNQRYRQVQAMLQSNIAIILRDLGQFAAAINPLRSATEILRQQAELLDFASESYLPVALNHFELAQTFVKLEDATNAETELDKCDEVVQEILSKDPRFTPALGQSLDDMLLRYEIHKNKSQPDWRSMENFAHSSIKIARELIAESPDAVEFSKKLPIALLNLAEIHCEKSDYAAANTNVAEARVSLNLLRNTQDGAGEQLTQIEARCEQLQMEIDRHLNK